jgi:4,4'-diaponeurosporenoate glycosyltransferase
MSATELLSVLLRLGIGCWLLVALRRLRPAGRTDPARTDLTGVSVIVPARDEERSLPTLLDSLPPHLEVVVVDDGSADATGTVAQAAGASVVRPPPPPTGWTGKSWACSRGVSASTGELLVFVDADVWFPAGGLEAVLAAHRTAGGLVSVQPSHEPGSGVEELVQLFNIVAVAGTDAGSPLGRWRGSRGAFGPVLATSRSDYERVGGHEAVRASVVEDVALSDRYRAHRLPVRVLAGGSAVSFRMYPQGLGQLVEGFTKNLVAGLGSIRRSTALLVLAWSTLLVQGSVAPVRAVLGGDLATARAAAALYLAVAAQVWWMGRQVGRFRPVTSLLFPVSTALFLFVFARSVVAWARGSVSWRGRRVATRPRPDR